jgi:glycosyltransferase involved in cell wall biosynthesis
MRQRHTIAVLVPCYNEAESIGAVVRDFARELPGAEVFVYDNASSDGTARVAAEAGATVRFEARRGKGNVVRRMFADIDADIYVIVDGDGTYDPASAPLMVDKLLAERLDMVVGARKPLEGDPRVYRRGHTSGNLLFSWAVRRLFGGDFTDVFSGYRVISRRFVKSLPVFSPGFEIETELSAHAQRVLASSAEVPTGYGSRIGDSTSKLRTYRDGLRILKALVRLFEEIRPLQFFGICFALLTAAALALGIPVVADYARSGLVLRFPTAILAASIQLVGFLSLLAGVLLRSVGRARDESRRLVYLQIPAPWIDTVWRVAPPAPPSRDAGMPVLPGGRSSPDEGSVEVLDSGLEADRR